MIDLWNRFKGWSVLEYFLLHPDTKVHANELARTLKVSPYTAHRFCRAYCEEGILLETKTGNVHQFRLAEEDSRVRALRRFIGPYLVADRKHLAPFLAKNRNVLSVSIYGSFAAGDYGDRSDIDILVITSDERKPDTRDLSALELRLGREAGVTHIPLARWRAMERKGDAFFNAVRKSHVLVWGNPA